MSIICVCVCVSLCTCFQYRDSDIDRDIIYDDNIIHNSNIQCLLYLLSIEAMNATTISPNRIATVNYMIIYIYTKYQRCR